MLLTLLSSLQLMHLDVDFRIHESPPNNIVFDIKDFDPHNYVRPDATNVLYPSLIIETDPSDFLTITHQSTSDYYNFISSFKQGADIVVRVSTAYTYEEAVTIAHHYGNIVGQIPSLIRRNVETLTLLEGDGHPTSGVHTKTYVDLRINKLGVKEENLIHDFVHATFNGGRDTLLNKQQWLYAVKEDNFFPSDYAASEPWEEDVPESIIPYLIVRWRPERFDPDLVEFYESKMFSRFSILDSLNWQFDE